MFVGCLFEQGTRLFTESHRSICRRDARQAMSEEFLEFVNIVRAFAPATSMLAVDRLHSQSTRTNAEDKRILSNYEPGIYGQMKWIDL